MNRFRFFWGCLCLLGVQLSAQAQEVESTFDIGLTRQNRLNLGVMSLQNDSNHFELDVLKLYRYLKSDSLGYAQRLFPLFSYTRHNDFSQFKLLASDYFGVFNYKTEDSVSSYSVLQLAPRFSLFSSRYGDHGTSETNIGFLFSFSQNKKEHIRQNSLLPLWYSGSNALDSTDYKVLFPLYWSFNSGQTGSNSLFPLYHHSWDNDKGNSLTAITPLFWHYADQDMTRNTLFPLFMAKSSPQETWVNVLGVYDYQDSDTLGYHNRLFPLYNYQQKDSLTQFNLLAIDELGVFRYRSDSHNSTYNVLGITSDFNLMSFQFDEQGLSKYNIGFVFSYSRKDNTNSEKSNLLPLWYRETNYNDSTSYKVLFPLYWSFDSPERYTHSIPPLYYHSQDKEKHSSLTAITPLFWYHADQDYTSSALLPLYIDIENPQSKILALGPLYGSFENKLKKASLRHIGLVYWKYKTETFNFSLTLPFNFSIAYNDGVSFSYYTPSIYSYSTPEFSSFMNFPFYAYFLDLEEKSNLYAYSPLYWRYSTPDISSDIFIPLWYNYKNRKTEESTNVVFPFYWKFEDSLDVHQTVFPLFYKKTNKLNGNSTLSITPFYWKYNSGTREKNIFFPLYFNTSDTTDHGSSLVLFPFFWQKKTDYESSLTVFPLFNQYSSVNPYLHVNTSSGYLFPLYSYLNTDERDYLNIYPLFYKGKYEDRYYHWFIPFYFYNSHDKDSSLGITPLFWHNETEKYSSNLLLPLWYSSTNKSDSDYFKTVFPLYWETQSKDSYLNTLLPLYFYKKSADSTRLGITPLFWHNESKKSSSNFLFPLWYNYSSEKTSQVNVLWKLYSKYEEKGSFTEYSWLYNLFSYTTHQNHDFDLNLFFYLYRNLSVDESSHHYFFPFYSFREDSNGESSSSVLLNFYNSSREKIEGTDEFYEETRIFWFIRMKSNYQYLKSKGIEVE